VEPRPVTDEDIARWEPLVYYLASRMIEPGGTRDDLMQVGRVEVFEVLSRKWDPERKRCSLKTYMHTSVWGAMKRAFRDGKAGRTTITVPAWRHKRGERNQEVQSYDAIEGAEDRIAGIGDPHSDIDAWIEREALKDRLREALPRAGLTRREEGSLLESLRQVPYAARRDRNFTFAARGHLRRAAKAYDRREACKCGG
jgi:RNA polymerase sigma factor (sigma-70 family)